MAMYSVSKLGVLLLLGCVLLLSDGNWAAKQPAFLTLVKAEEAEAEDSEAPAVETVGEVEEKEKEEEKDDEVAVEDGEESSDEEEPVTPEPQGPTSHADAEDKEQLSAEELAALKDKAEPHRFQAEVERMMGIIINSLYTEKEVFLRELISNAADALEKIRFLSITDESALGSTQDMEIRVTYDKDAQTLTVADTGIGMTKQELINNLGTVAKSGTSNFLEALAQGGDVNLVGQFGVGFYSAYLVADKVVVTTKSNTDKQYIWESSADAHFSVVEDPRGDTLGRGTRVTLHLKPDATEFATERKLRECIKRYSQFIPHPIYLAVEKTKKVEEPADEEGGEKKKTEVKYKEWELENEQKAIWMRSVKDVTEDEYDEFYKSISKDYSKPLAHLHFAAEGEVEFKSIIYIPQRGSSDAWQQYFGSSTGMKLYVRRVLVSDSFDDLLPKYLHWIKGVVDSDDLPLKVDREQLSQNKVMKSISKKLVRKAIELVKKLSKDDEKAQLKQAESGADPSVKAPETEKYETFLKEFGRNLKLGCFEDDANRSKIIKVLRFPTMRTPTKPISIDQYIDDMGESTKEIYYMSADSIETAMASPLLKTFQAKNINVLFLVDPTEESCLARINDFEGKKLVSIQKGDLNLDDTEDSRKRMTKLNKMFSPLTDAIRSQLAGKVGKVVVSTRTLEDPLVVVASQHGYSAYMEKVLKTQTFANIDQIKAMAGMKTLEINPSHPIMQEMLERVKSDKEDQMVKNSLQALFSAAMVASGFELPDGQASTISNFVYAAIGKEVGAGSALVEPQLPADDPEDIDAEDIEVGDDDVAEEVEEEAEPVKEEEPLDTLEEEEEKRDEL